MNDTEIYTSLAATKSYLQKHDLRPLCLLSDDALREFDDIDKNDPNAVVVGLAPEQFSYNKLNSAFR